MKLCKIDDCNNNIYARGWCSKHYRRWYKHGDPVISKNRRETWKGRHPCIIDGCNNIRVAQGYCKKHYRKWQRYGNPLVVLRQYGINKGKTCSVKNCFLPARGKGMCAKHYKRYKKYGDPAKTFMDYRVPKVCKLEYCSRSTEAFGYCQFHYKLVKAKDFTCNKSFDDLYGNPPYQCYICGEIHEQCTSEFFELDHIIPVSRGGRDLPDNVKLVCIQCNRSKQSLTDIEFITLCHKINNFHT